ncbi:MAG: GNAT family N-acetyltransferase [Nocardioidaceae bacterium]
MNPGAGTVVARPAAPADEELLRAWRNDEQTRRWSRSNAVLAAADHHAWLTRTLADPHRHLWVVEQDEAPVATVRHDRIAPGRYEVSVTVAPEVRGRGWAAPALRTAQCALQRVDPGLSVIEAHIRVEHGASMAVFERSGYRRVGADDNGLVLLELAV